MDKVERDKNRSPLEGQVVRGKIFSKGQKKIQQHLFRACLEAREVAAKAQENAREIEEKAQKRVEEIFEEARKRGIEEGKAELTEILTKAALEASRLRQRAEPQMIELATQMAKRIIEEELSTHPEKICLVARKALNKAQWAQWIRIRANPEDLSRLRTGKETLMAELANTSEISFVSDPQIPIGGCIVETESGEVDARLETQLDAMQRALQEGLENG